MNKEKNVMEYYDKYWLDVNKDKQEKSDLRDYEEEAREYVFDFLKKHFISLRNKNVLEIGPGRGYDVLEFAKNNAKVIAIDISKNSLNSTNELLKTNKLSKNVRLIEMDANNLKFKKNQFDIIFILSTLMHLNHSKVIKKCIEILKNNGVLVSIEPINENILIKIYRKIFSDFEKLNPNYLKYKDLISISKFFNKSYIKVFYLFSFLSLIFRENKFLYKISSKFLKILEKSLLKIFPSLEKKCWLSASIFIK